MDLELVLFKACPFAQRVVITLLHTQLPYKGTFINPGQPPAWLQEIAPLGQIPLLRVQGQAQIFDSSAINEYLNELSGGGLLPDDPLERANCRCWIEFAGVCQREFAKLITAMSATEFQEVGASLLGKLRWLAGEVADGSPFFSHNRLSLVDVAYAPLFMRMQHLQHVVPFYQPTDLPTLQQWQANLLALTVVQRSVDGDFATIFRAMVRGRGKGGFVDSQLES